MKKIWIMPLALLALGGCEDSLQESPESFLAPENFYQTPSDMDAALAAAYQPLTSGIEAFGRNLWNTLDAGSDEAISNPAVPSAVAQAFGLLNFGPDQERIVSPWSRFYQTITRANIVIDRTPKISGTQERKNAILGEAKFLRAFSYFYLVRLWGGVPLVLTEADALKMDMPRAPVEEVYAQIVADAQEAANSLPARWDGANAGRATRGAALALLSKVYLTRQEWQKAADAAKEVIDSNVYSLHSNFLQNFVPAGNNGVESVFALQVSSEPGLPGSRFVDMYFPREVGAGRGGGWAWVVPNLWLVNSFMPGDYRREVTYETRFFNQRTNQWQTVNKPHVYKFRPSVVLNTNAGDVNIPIFRYAEVLLIYAEALNELGRPQEAVQSLNLLRARARNANGTARATPANYSGPVTQAAVREAIFQERLWELAHEAKRWFDLVRRGQEYWASQLRAHDPQAQVEPHKMLLPIPQEEISQNKALEQNPGY